MSTQTSGAPRRKTRRLVLVLAVLACAAAVILLSGVFRNEASCTPRQRRAGVKTLCTALSELGYCVSEADCSDGSYYTLAEGARLELDDPLYRYDSAVQKLLGGYLCYFNFGAAGTEQSPQLRSSWESGSCTVEVYVFGSEALALEAMEDVRQKGRATRLDTAAPDWPMPSYRMLETGASAPHWYRQGNLVFWIDCADNAVLDDMKRLFGKPFAGE